MIGSIIGDVAGSFYEIFNIKTKDFELFSNRSRYTDDSVLTVATAEWLLYGGEPSTYYSDWGNSFPAAGYGGMFQDWLWMMRNKGYAEPYMSFGNGSAMRVGPIGWAFDSIEETLAAARKTAECTHNHQEGIKGAQAIALAVYLARNGKTKKDIKDNIIRIFGYNLDFTLDEIRPEYGWRSRFGNSVTCMGSVPQAIVAFLEGKNFEDCIRNAISIGGDSDTIACMTGSIAEAYYGIPEDIREKVIKFLPKKFLPIINAFERRYQRKEVPESHIEGVDTMLRQQGKDWVGKLSREGVDVPLYLVKHVIHQSGWLMMSPHRGEINREKGTRRIYLSENAADTVDIKDELIERYHLKKHIINLWNKDHPSDCISNLDGNVDEYIENL